MKNGNTTLYIVIGVIALSVIGFLLIQNKTLFNNSKGETANSNSEVVGETNNPEDSPNQEPTPVPVIGRTVMSTEKNIYENITESQEFSNLADAIQSAGLEETLKQDGPYTIFAPINTAFGNLSSATIQNLLQPENQDELANILTYHVVPGDYSSFDLADGLTLTTVQGQNLTITFTDGQWWINNIARITATDGNSSNGVIYSIDAVLLPN